MRYLSLALPSQRSPAPLRRRGGVVRAVAAALAACVLAAGCGREAPDPAERVEAVMADAARRAGALEARQHAAPASLSDEEVIALGYLERLRLGMGSPFRLADYARTDPRLSPATRAMVGHAIVGAVAAGRGHEVDPRALGGMGGTPDTPWLRAARLHGEAIERAVLAAEDPRAGELAVRMAYRLAGAEEAVGPHGPDLAAAAAALVRDRELARRDARRLLVHAKAAGADPLALLAAWREGRHFAVEAPTAAPVPAAVEGEALRLAPALGREFREIPARAALPEWPGTDSVPASRLAGLTALRLSVLAARRDLPPQAPVTVTVERYEPEMLRQVRGSGVLREAVRRFVARSRGEERFAAELAIAEAGLGERMPGIALVALRTAVALRPYAQERVWHPGWGGPSPAELRRMGVGEVAFDRGVPAAWRPYYRRMVAGAVGDLRAVLPGVDLRGVKFHVGVTGRERTVLATHEAGTRTIRLPPERAAGTIGHELAHDLDRQVAARRYGRRGRYATDLAVRRGPGDRFAAAARSLPDPALAAMADPAYARYARRPAEVFARTFDGYLAALLARQGRSNGYLSSVQDEVLLGYGGAIAPDAGGLGAAPFLTMLTVASPLPKAEREEFLRQWGSGRPRGGMVVAASVLAGEGEVPPRAEPGEVDLRELARRREAVRREVEAALGKRDALLREMSEAVCRNPLAAHTPQGSRAMRTLVDAATESRVRGVLLRHARALGGPGAAELLWDGWTEPAPAGFDPEPKRTEATSSDPALVFARPFAPAAECGGAPGGIP